MKHPLPTPRRRTTRVACASLLASVASASCVVERFVEPPGTTAVVASSSPTTPASTPASTPAATPSSQPKSLAAIIGADAAAELMESHGVPVVSPNSPVKTMHAQPRCVGAADAGHPVDASLRSDAGTSPAVAHALWKPPSPPPSIAIDPTYAARMSPANRRALGAAAVPFAVWLNSVHTRVHPIWSDSYLESLASLPCDDKKNDPTLYAAVELVVEGKTGRLIHVGISRSSGIDDFDAAAVASFMRATPFPIPRPPTWSTDGNVYVIWEVFRDETYACTTMNVRPYLLNLPPTP